MTGTTPHPPWFDPTPPRAEDCVLRDVLRRNAAAHADRRRSLEDSGAQVAVASDSSLRAALQCLGERDISSLLLEGGAALQCAAWHEDVVDFVRLYVTPHVLGSGGVPFLDGCRFSTTALARRRIVPLGPDVLIEGYVHGPH